MGCASKTCGIEREARDLNAAEANGHAIGSQRNARDRLQQTARASGELQACIKEHQAVSMNSAERWYHSIEARCVLFAFAAARVVCSLPLLLRSQ